LYEIWGVRESDLWFFLFWCLQVENAEEGAGAVSGESDTVFRRNKVRSGFNFLKLFGWKHELAFSDWHFLFSRVLSHVWLFWVSGIWKQFFEVDMELVEVAEVSVTGRGKFCNVNVF
jgi:hypothetical protein